MMALSPDNPLPSRQIWLSACPKKDKGRGTMPKRTNPDGPGGPSGKMVKKDCSNHPWAAKTYEQAKIPG